MLEKFKKRLARVIKGSDGPPEPVDPIIDRVRQRHLTYLSIERLNALLGCCQALDEQGVEGKIIEAGCALGGSSIAMCAVKGQRPLEVYDVFGMIPPPGENDGQDVHERYEVIRSGQSKGIGGDTYYGYVEDLKGQVEASFRAMGYPIEQHQVRLVEGLVQDTLHVDEPVGLAHIDVDWYEPVTTCLERIVPHLSVGGFLVIDDYMDWSGSRKAVDDFFASQEREDWAFDTTAGSLVIGRLG